jgi:hypothetical protein
MTSHTHGHPAETHMPLSGHGHIVTVHYPYSVSRRRIARPTCRAEMELRRDGVLLRPLATRLFPTLWLPTDVLDHGERRSTTVALRLRGRHDEVLLTGARNIGTRQVAVLLEAFGLRIVDSPLRSRAGQLLTPRVLVQLALLVFVLSLCLRERPAWGAFVVCLASLALIRISTLGGRTLTPTPDGRWESAVIPIEPAVITEPS